MRNTLLVALAAIILSSCVTFERCKSKFGENAVTDSIKVMVPVSVLVPKDSVVTSFITDTTYFYKEIIQGRAKVIVERTNTITTVQAQCDTVTIIKKVPVKVPGPQVIWGVAPWHKTAFRWTATALILAIVYMVFGKFFTRKRKDAVLPTDDKF